MATLEKEPAESLQLNDIGAVVIECTQSVFADAYKRNRATGCFILIDPQTNETVGAGMITARPVEQTLPAPEHSGRVTPSERAARFGHGPVFVWLGDQTDLAYQTERILYDKGWLVHTLEEEDSTRLRAAAEHLLAAGAIVLCVSKNPVDEAAVLPCRYVDGSAMDAAAIAGALEG